VVVYQERQCTILVTRVCMQHHWGDWVLSRSMSTGRGSAMIVRGLHLVLWWSEPTLIWCWTFSCAHSCLKSNVITCCRNSWKNFSLWNNCERPFCSSVEYFDLRCNMNICKTVYFKQRKHILLSVNRFNITSEYELILVIGCGSTSVISLDFTDCL